MIASTIFVALSLLPPAQAPALRFTKGETLRYKTTMTGSRSASFKGSTQAMSYSGGCTMTLSVTSASAASAKMKVAYSGSFAKATVTALPPEMRAKKAEFEKAASDGIAKGMVSGGRSQSVTSRGIATFTIPLGDGKSMTISDGAFMMLVLPGTALSSGKTWRANVRMPIPEATGSIKVAYSFAGMQAFGGQQAYKITFASSDTQNQAKGEISAKMTTSLTGSILLGATSGKVLYGEVKRDSSTTLTHKTQGTRTAKQISIQTFTKQ